MRGTWFVMAHKLGLWSSSEPVELYSSFDAVGRGAVPCPRTTCDLGAVPRVGLRSAGTTAALAFNDMQEESSECLGKRFHFHYLASVVFRATFVGTVCSMNGPSSMEHGDVIILGINNIELMEPQ